MKDLHYTLCIQSPRKQWRDQISDLKSVSVHTLYDYVWYSLRSHHLVGNLAAGRPWQRPTLITYLHLKHLQSLYLRKPSLLQESIPQASRIPTIAEQDRFLLHKLLSWLFPAGDWIVVAVIEFQNDWIPADGCVLPSCLKQYDNKNELHLYHNANP